MSVTYGCIRFIDSYRFLSSSLDSLVKRLVDQSKKTLKNLNDEIVEKDEVLKIVNGIVEEDKTFKGWQKDYPDKFETVEETLLNCVGEIDLKTLKTVFPDDKWKYLT